MKIIFSAKLKKFFVKFAEVKGFVIVDVSLVPVPFVGVYRVRVSSNDGMSVLNYVTQEDLNKFEKI